MYQLLIAVIFGVTTVYVHQLTPQEMILDTFHDAPVMYYIARVESGFDPTAKNPHSTASGLFQIISGTWKDTGCSGDVFNPKDNIECARKLYDKQGTTPWKESRPMWDKSALVSKE